MLELEGARVDEQRRKKAWVKMGDPYPFIEVAKTMRLPTCLMKSLFSKRHVGWHGWVTRTRINEDPVIRGHDLCFDKTCRGNRLAISAVAGFGKTVQIMTRPWCDVTLSKVVSRLYLWNIVLSTVVCENRLAKPDII